MAKAKAKAKVIKEEKIKIKNNTPYFKVDPDSGQKFNAYEICEVKEISKWLEVQMAAKLFERVE